MNRKIKIASIVGLCLILLCAITVASAIPASGDLLTRRFRSSVSPGKITYTSVYNVDFVSSEQLKQISGMAKEAGGKVFYHFDTLSGNKVGGRVTVNPHLVKDEGRNYNFSLDVSDSAVKNVRESAAQKFGKTPAVIKCSEQDYGMVVMIAAKLDLAGLDKENLSVYSFDEVTGEYTKIEKSVHVCKAGFVYFETVKAGYLIIV